MSHQLIDYTFLARLKRIIDADTYKLDVDQGFNSHSHVTLRLRGVNAPERGAAGSLEAVQWVTEQISQAQLLVTSYHGRMTFARWVCDVSIVNPATLALTDLASAMIAAGHAVKYP